MTEWCQNNNFALNVSRRGRPRIHKPVFIDGMMVKRVKYFTLLGVHISEGLSWSQHVPIIKKAHRCHYFQRKLWRFGMSSIIILNFYRCTLESMLTGHITTWFGRDVTSRDVTFEGMYRSRCLKKEASIIKDSHKSAYTLISLLPSGRRHCRQITVFFCCILWCLQNTMFTYLLCCCK